MHARARWWIALVAGLVGQVGLAAPAWAGRARMAWLPATEVVPERGAEIEADLADLDNVLPGDLDESVLTWAATIGLTDQLELSLPVDLQWRRPAGAPATTQFARWGAEARYRLASSDPVDAPALVPLVRVALARVVSERRAAEVELGLHLGLAVRCVHLQLGADLATVIRRGEDTLTLRPGLGVSGRVVGELHLGFEVVATHDLRGGQADWLALGPSLGWTHGRSWLTAGAALGVTGIDGAARLRWGIAF
ncbi:MAG: hypothetical protein KBG28_30160 [Kofleriaceae bacterium]|jgi:hypothetical protein|nr:hypothetical protein [Kofleriaceae bacterium]MBP9208272.1 hypothetical protein [Kofleriaceae bacterium]